MTKLFEEALALNGVSAFHRLFEMPILEAPQIPSRERCKLRVALLEEELNELKEAIENNDIQEAADALCDLQYVLSGAILEFGLGKKFHSMFEEVQRSNMSKACQSLDEAEQTRNKYLTEKQVDSEIREKESVFLVYRAEDGKVLKSVNYRPADISKFL